MRPHHSRSVLMACTATALLMAAVPALAQQQEEQEGPVLLNTLNVQGKRPASAATDTPLATQTTQEEIARREIDSVKDLGNTTEPGLDYNRRTDSVSIRGLSGPRVLTVVDGIPIPFMENNARGGSGPTGSVTNADGGTTSFDFSSLSAVDVLRGADSSRAGLGALGGALVLRTLEPEDLLTDGKNWGALAKATYDSSDFGLSGSVAVAGRSNGTSVLFQTSYMKSHETLTKGTDDSAGRARTMANPADNDRLNLLFKLRHDFEGGHRVGLTAERYERKSNVGLATDWTVLNGRGASQYVYQPYRYYGHDNTRRERISLEYDYTAPVAGGFLESASAIAYWQRLTKNAGAQGPQVNTQTGAETPYMRDNELKQGAFGFVGGAAGSYTTGSLLNEWRLGVDIQRFNSTHYIDAIPVNQAQTDIPEVDGTRFGVYLDNRIGFGNSGFALTPGLRFDWIQYTPVATPGFINENDGAGIFGLPPQRTDSHLTPKLLATYDVNPQFQLFGQWSMAYRAPTVNELYHNFTNVTTGYAQLGNPDLKAETGHGFEAGAAFGGGDFGGRVAAFHNRYTNFIDVTPLTPDPNYPNLAFGIGRYINLEQVHISGVEAQAYRRFSNGIQLQGALSYAYGRNVVAGTTLRSVAPLKAVIGVGYEQEHWGVNLTGIFAAGMEDDGDPATFDAPGYGVANLTGWWEPKQLNGLRIQAGIYNLFDTTYYDALGVRNVNLTAASSQPQLFYSEPGRSVRLSLTQRF